MGLSNASGHLVLTTGNKSELATGYSTLYGDSAGGFGPIKDVPKTMVWELARWRNGEASRLGLTPPIPENSITKPPSAELAPAGFPATGLPAENLQARVRGVVLMAYSNATGAIVLTTGNKSELATGYSTLYGDSAGGFAVIKDVPKTLVYRLCRHRNELAGFDLVPESVLTKAPSAELRPNQDRKSVV